MQTGSLTNSACSFYQDSRDDFDLITGNAMTFYKLSNQAVDYFPVFDRTTQDKKEGKWLWSGPNERRKKLHIARLKGPVIKTRGPHCIRMFFSEMGDVAAGLEFYRYENGQTGERAWYYYRGEQADRRNPWVHIAVDPEKDKRTPFPYRVSKQPPFLYRVGMEFRIVGLPALFMP